MNNNQIDNKEPEFFTPNAPDRYVKTSGKGWIIACGVMVVLYIIGVVVGLCLGYGWASLFFPFIPFAVMGFLGCICGLFKKFYNLGYDKNVGFEETT